MQESRADFQVPSGPQALLYCNPSQLVAQPGAHCPPLHAPSSSAHNSALTALLPAQPAGQHRQLRCFLEPTFHMLPQDGVLVRPRYLAALIHSPVTTEVMQCPHYTRLPLLSGSSAHRAPLVVPKPFATAYLCVRELATKRPCLWLVTHSFPLTQQFLLCLSSFYFVLLYTTG